MATMNDIAKLAGVSRGTVSNVLNNHGVVSYDKIKLVEEAAAKLGYNLDKNAKALRSGYTNVLALIIPSISHRRYADLYVGILKYAQKNAFDVRLYITSDFPYKEAKAIDTALKERVCGILTISCLDDSSLYAPCEASNIPIIFLERPAPNDRFPSFSLDFGKAFSRLANQTRLEKISVITENIRFQNQYHLMKELKRAFKFSDLSFYEYTGSESETIYDVVKNTHKNEVYITSNEEIASKLENVYFSFYSTKPVIYTLSSLRPERNLHFHDIPLNYRRLGRLAAKALIENKQYNQKIESFVLPSPEHETEHSFTPCVTTKPITLRMLAHKTPAINALQKLTPEFTALTGIKVEIESVSLHDSLKEMHLPEREWDIIRIDPSTLYYVAPTILTSLEDIDKDCRDSFANFLPNIPKDYSISGSAIYAFPFDISMQLMFYRKSWFDSIREQRAYFEATGNVLSVPQSFAEYDNICRFFTKSLRPDSPSVYGSSGILANPTSVANLFIPRLIAENGLMYNSHNHLNLLSEPALKALSEYVELTKYSDPKIASGWSEIAENFVNGFYAVSILYSNHASLLIRTNSIDLNGEIGFAPVPSGNSILAGGSLGVGKYSRHKEAAYHFIRWATGPAIAPRLVQLGGASACNNVYQQEALLDIYPWLNFIQSNISTAIRRPMFFFGSYAYNQHDLEYILGSNIIAAIRGSKTLEEALENTQNYINSLVPLNAET